MQTHLSFAVSDILQDQQRLVEKDLLRFALADTVLGNALSAIAFVPFEAFDARKINHLVYIIEIYVFAIKPVCALALVGAFLANVPEPALGTRD